jgi:hypothetical protein
MSKKQKVDDEENQTLAAQVKKRKEIEEGSPRRSKKPHHKGDVSKFQCLNFMNMGHYSTQCPHKHEKEKEKKKHVHMQQKMKSTQRHQRKKIFSFIEWCFSYER